tara:strand:+ start:190 stop:552 length:363 start_codon:yes stop_codon:yes gene_type:complete
MSYNWCHGPNCHTTETQSRVRGSGDNKVLRTIKIKQGRYNGYQNGIWDYFCNNRCLFDFIRTHLQSIIAIAPRREPLETPVKVVKEKYQNHRTEWNDQGSGYKQVPYMSTRITIKSVDNA